MYEVKPTARFKKDLKLLVKRGCNISLLTEAVELRAHLCLRVTETMS